MTDHLELLKKLQTFDAELFRLRRQQQDKPKELAAVNALAAEQEAKTKAAEDRLKTEQMAQKEKEIDLQTREASVKKLQAQLFQVKTNKEYSAMQREIESLKADNSLLEEAILKTFDAVELAKRACQQERDQLAQANERLRVEQGRIQREQQELGARIETLQRERAMVTPSVPPPMLATYDRILQNREGLALVPLAGNSCGGCHRRLPPQVVNEVYLKHKLTTCESCNRILYTDEVLSGS